MGAYLFRLMLAETLTNENRKTMSALFNQLKSKGTRLTLLGVLLFCCSVNATGTAAVTGSAGRDFIVAGATAARVEAGSGDDFIVGGAGDNTFLINKDDGQDTIYELAGTNTVEFGAGISFSDIASGLMKSGDDLILRIGQSGQSLTVKFFFSHSNTINQFRLSNGQVITAGQLLGAFGMAAPTASATVPALLTAQAPDIELAGSSNADVLIARHGTLRMQGLANNDILVPRGPAVTMEFGLASGKNLIIAYEGDNTVLFSADVAYNDIAMNLRRSGDDLQLINSRDGSEVRVYQFFTRANTITRIRFASGGEITAAQLFGLFGVATPEQAHHYHMVSPGVTFDNNEPGTGDGDGDDNGGGDDDGGGGDNGGGTDPEPCSGAECEDTDDTNYVVIEGTAQDDLLIADQRDSLFRPGAGNDIMLGGAGNNRYVVAKGDGADVIIDTEGRNEVHFAADIAWGDISSGLVRSGNDLMLRIGQNGQTLTVQSFFTLADTIELFQLHSGQTLTRQQLFQIFSATAPSQTLAARQLILGRSGETLLQGTEGGDILLNRMAVNAIDAKAGDDIFILQYTAPSYNINNNQAGTEQRLTLEFAPGHGKDVLYTLGDTNLGVVLNFAAGISRSEVFQNMRRMGDDLFIKTYSDTDEVRLAGFFIYYNHLKSIQFAEDSSSQIDGWEIYEGFNTERPEQSQQFAVGLPNQTLLSCEELFSRYDTAALAGFAADNTLVIQPPADLAMSIFYQTHIQFIAQSQNNELVCFLLQPVSNEISMQPDSGVLSWAAGREDIGTKDISIKVVTDAQTYNQIPVTLQIPDLNQAPKVESEPLTVAFADVALSDYVWASDSDNYNDDIVFSLVQAPLGMTLAASGSIAADINWTPTAEQVGTHDVVVRAQDKYGKYSELAYSIEVKTFYTLANVPPGYSKVPKTGATTFDDAQEDGATRLGTERVFERDHVREVVRDRVSDLVWQDNAVVLDFQTTYGGAKHYCENLDHAGITDWRLPTRLELAYLPNMATRRYEDAFKFGWVSSRYEKSFHAEKVFGTHYSDTRSWETIVDRIPRALNKTDNAYVRCVSGEKPYQPKYVRASLFDVVADSTHLLLWEDQARILGQERLAWEDQAQYCANLDLAGFDDWRLPNNYESQTLASLFDENGGGLFNGRARMPNPFKYLPMMSGDSFGSWLSANKGTYFIYRRGNEHYVFDMTAQVDRDHSNGSPLTGYSRCVRTYSPPVPLVSEFDIEIDLSGSQAMLKTRLDASQSYSNIGQISRFRWMNTATEEVLSESAVFDVNLPLPGSYDVKLTVWDQHGIPADYPELLHLAVELPPGVDVTPRINVQVPSEIYSNTEITIDASASQVDLGPLSYQWYLNDQLISEQALLKLSINDLGTHTLKLVVTSAFGISTVVTSEIVVVAGRALEQCPYKPLKDDRSYNGFYPDDNIPWTGDNAQTVDDIARAFNYARSQDPSVYQHLVMPTQAVWDAMTVQQKGLYLVNAERVARGIKPYAGFDAAMVEVAQTYADYIQGYNQIIGHHNDGRSPMERMLAHPYIGANADRHIRKPESVASISGSPTTISVDRALAQAIYGWLYEDKDWFVAFGISGTPWGHRDHLLQTGLDDNHDENTTEGVVGFGLTRGLYQPGVNPATKQGAVTVFKTIDQGPNWDSSRIQTVDFSLAQGCPMHQLDVNEAELSGLRQLNVTPASVHLALGQSTQLTLTGIYNDGSQRDLTALAQFKADAYSVVSVQNGVLYAEQAGDTTVSVNLAGIESNRVYVSIGEPADTTVLNGTEAEPLKTYIAENATVRSINPLAVAVYTGIVHDRYGTPLSDVQLSLLNAPEYGSVKTDNDGRFMLAGPAGEQTVVYEKPGYVVLQRTAIGASSNWAALPDVTLLARDSKQSLIDLTSGTAQVHQSSVISDEFGERRATVVFNGITSAEIRSQNGARRPITQFMFSATEFETPASMPGELPAETAFTWASDLHVDGTHYTDSVHYNADVVLYLDNFLGFPVGEIVPVGYFDRTISKWIASPNGVVVRLLDTNGDGTVDGVDYNDDGIADDINNNGSTADEAVGLATYAAGDTLWRAAFNHMTPVDLNWAAAGAEAPEAIELLDGDTGAEDEKNEEELCTGSFAKPYQQSFHEDIAIAGTDLRLHYSSQRTSGYKHKIHVAVSGDNIPASLEKMIARFEIAGRVFEQEFNPAPNVETEFIWDGTHPDGSRAKGIVSGRISIGFEYPTVYLSSGNAAQTGQPLSSFPVAWATLSDVVTQVPGRENVITWQQRGVSIKNTFDSQLAEGWSLSNVHEFDPKGKVYFGSGMVADVATSSLILRTGQTYSHVEFDDGYYQAGGRNTDYVISSDNIVIDRVTGLEWQNVTTPVRFRSKNEARAYCAALPTDNQHAWRIPTAKEVGYTIDKSGASSGLIMYSITQARYMWHENTLNQDNALIAAVCLRGDKLDESTVTGLSRNANLEVVVDKNSGLMWQDNADNIGVKLDWQSSIAHCEASEHAGFDDWRLPNINELLYTLPNQVFQHYTTLPIGIPWHVEAEQRNPYWSSTTNLQNDDQAWAIESKSFNSERFKKEDAYHVRCVRQDSTSSRMPFRFNSKGLHTATFDNSAGKDLTLYQYNDAGKLSQITDRFGNTLTIERDPTGRVTAIVAPDGQHTQLAVDEHNHLTAITYEDGSDYQFFYQEGGLLAEKTDPNNYIFGRHYNALGRVERVTAPEGAEWQFFDTRDARGINRYGYSTAENNSYQTERKVLADGSVQYSTTNESGGQTAYRVSADELSETSSAYGVTTTVTNVLDSKTLQPIPHTIVTTVPSGLTNTTTLTKTYAENGADTSVYTIGALSNGKTSTVAVNARSGVTQSTSPEGRSSTSYLDPETLLLNKLSVPGLLDTTYSYDSRGRLVQSSTGERHTSYVYDVAARGQVSSITAADGKITSYEYDDLGRVTKVTYPDGHSTQTQYDANGNAIAVIVPSAEQHDFTVNGVGNTDSETRPVASTTRYLYNKDKQLTGITLPSGDSISYSYQDGRLLSTQTPEGSSDYLYQQGDQLAQVTEGTEAVSYSYDGTLLTALSYSGELNTSLNYSYNTDLQVSSLSYAGASTTLSYDNDGLVTGIHGFDISYSAENGLPQQLSDGKLSQNWLWNGYGEATSVQYQLGTQASLGYALEYNSVGLITRKTERQHDGSELVYDYAYDDRYRLVEVKQNSAVVESYGYDANGNRTSHSSLLRGVANQITSYVAGDQLAQSGNAVYSYDANGRLSQKTVTENDVTEATQYQYSSTGRLLAVTTADKAISYRHNALGQRVAKLVDGVVTEKYLWQDLTTLLAVYNADDTVKQRFEYGLSHTPVSFSQSGQRYYIQTDHLGSPRVISSATGTVIKTLSYDSYGNVISDSNPDFTIQFGFAGGLYDADTQLIRFGYRDYDPETGRWTARDPIGFAGGDTNLYGYVLGDTVNFIDSNGLAACNYSITGKTLRCVSNTANDPNFVGPHNEKTLGPEGVHSGRGQHMNNPQSTGVKDYGPIWPGTFNMVPNDNRPGWMALQETNWTPVISGVAYRLGLKRAGANLHLGTVSHGCITVDPAFKSDFEKMLQFLGKEQGQNILTVEP
ncbi:DUF1566 domain-containing protein [Rheinheimera muenzenbergensis]|uniref:DUF1566 domain-containing protein n=2 Tax=Rheinheimera muenzenbergensis TaxID=1193628 RepID=A0ABU8C3H8_9GAMM